MQEFRNPETTAERREAIEQEYEQLTRTVLDQNRDNLFGVMLLAQPSRAMSFLCLILGISIMADGLFKVQTAFDARRFGLRNWWLILALGIIAGCIGVVAAFRPAASARVLTILMGVSMMAEGALNLSVALCALKIVRSRKPDEIEIELDEK